MSGRSMFILRQVLMASQGKSMVLQQHSTTNRIPSEVEVSIGGVLEPEAKHIIDAGIEAGVSRIVALISPILIDLVVSIL